MSWLRNSPLRVSFGRRSSSISPPKDCDPSACFESFKRHWQQANDIICRTQVTAEGPGQDDVLGVVNNVDQLLSLLLLELRGPAEQQCLDHLLSERVLERLLGWGALTGRYSNVLRLEQLKLYELLLSNAPHLQLLTLQPFRQPLLGLLDFCLDECFPADIEKRLILLLNQLCVCLMQNPTLLDLFFSNEHGPKRFIIFALLIPYIHREGGVGHQARDAMLLCMSMSKKNQALGLYIAEHSHVCPVLATGLSGLYSLLPRKLEVEAEDWHCLTPDDVNEIPELTLFLNSLEFCNAVVQVAHPLVQAQMLEFLHHGFLVPVVGPALLQSVAEELVASTAYLELFLRSVTQPGLLHAFLRFLMCEQYDGERVIDKMVQRLGTKSRLCLVSISLFETLVGFNCEDVMLELVFRYLIPCTHVMLSQRKRIKDVDLHCRSAEKFLSLAPSVCSSRPNEHSSLNITRRRTGSTSSESPSSSQRTQDSLQGNYCAYLQDAHRKVKACTVACSTWRYPYDGDSPEQQRNQEQSRGGPFSVDSNRNLTSKMRDNAELPSLGASSGYESFACKEESRDSSPEPKSSTSQLSDPKSSASLLSDVGTSIEASQPPSLAMVTRTTTNKDTSYMDMFHTTPDIGPFLDLLLRQLENTMHNGLYLNLHLTGLLSRLAAFPQPLLASFLLNHSLVFQPSVRSLFQVLGSLKQRIDSYLSRHDHLGEMVAEAQAFLVGREERLVNARRLAQEGALLGAAGRRGSAGPEPFSRGEPKRKSFSSALSSVFKRAAQSAFLPVRENAIEYSPNGYRFTKKPNDAEVRGVVMSAVLLDEWLKELAALSLEHVACCGTAGS